MARRRGEQGAALVEFVLVAPVLLGLVLGIFTGGTAYYRKIAIVDSVREGARYGASLPVPGGLTGPTSWETSVKNRIVQASGGELSSADVCVKLVYAIGGTDCGVLDPTGASSETTVHLVKVSASRPASLEFFFFTTNTTVSARMVARFERDTG